MTLDSGSWARSHEPPPTPVFQYLSRSLGLDSVAFGYQQTIFGVLQLLGGPLFGRYSGEGKFEGPSPHKDLGPILGGHGRGRPTGVTTAPVSQMGTLRHRRALAPWRAGGSPAHD